jgi:hypothetical protein
MMTSSCHRTRECSSMATRWTSRVEPPNVGRGTAIRLAYIGRRDAMLSLIEESPKFVRGNLNCT